MDDGFQKQGELSLMNVQYQSYLASDDWKQKKKQKFNSVSRCAVCASMDNLHVHHLNYGNLYDCKQSDLRILCKRCHFLAHDLFKSGKFKFKNNNHNSRFALLKNAVKKELGIYSVNMFNESKLVH